MRLISLACTLPLLWNNIVLGSALRYTHKTSVEHKETSRSSPSDLQSLLSSNATISHNVSSAPRWSEYHAPTPGTIVHVATEQDVQTTVQYCLSNNIPFMAQSGGHGWIDGFDLNENGLLINLRGLNFTMFSTDKKSARVGGGALISEVIEAAYSNDAQIITGNCNCVGTLGAALGGGYGNLMGLYGFSVDNFISMNVVLANGSAVTITPNDEDLWWALRGAGPNFGVVTSAEMKAYPTAQKDNVAWFGGLSYTEDKIEQVVQAIEDLDLEPHMNIFLYYTTTGAPNFTPYVFVTPFYLGDEKDGRKAFKSMLDIGPFNDTTGMVPYNEWNTGANGFCIKGGRKPSYAAGFAHMVPSTWRSIWNTYVEWLQTPDTGYSSVLVECYSLKKAQSISSSTASFDNRNVRFNGVAIPWYTNATLDPSAEAWGSQVRNLWRSTDGFSQNQTYINFAYGDEVNSVVYANSTDRLRSLKKQYDPNNVFDHWFDISA